MLLFQISFLLVSFSFFGSTVQPQTTDTLASASTQICTPCDLLCLADTMSPEAAALHLSQSQLVFEDNIEIEQCFHELNEILIQAALNDTNPQSYTILDTLTQISDGYTSEALGASLNQLFHENTADFLTYYLNTSSSDFKFLFLSELEINCEMETELQVQTLKIRWIKLLLSYNASQEQTESFNELKSQIENL